MREWELSHLVQPETAEWQNSRFGPLAGLLRARELISTFLACAAALHPLGCR